MNKKMPKRSMAQTPWFDLVGVTRGVCCMLLLLLWLLTGPKPVHADYVIEQTTHELAFFVPKGTEMGQSFTVSGFSGAVTRIEVIPTLQGDATMTIYEGAGLGGTALHTQAVAFAGSSSFEALDLLTPVPVWSGQPYTFAFIPTTGLLGWRMSGLVSDPYPGGGIHTNVITIDQDMAFRIHVASNTLTVTKSGTGTGTVTSTPAGIDCGGTCQAGFPPNFAVTLTAQADANSVFVGWNGDCDANGQVTMDADKACTATFTRLFTMSVNTSGSGTGTVTSNPAGILCHTDCSEAYIEGMVVTLTAHPGAQSYLMSWGEDCDTNGRVTMDADKTCTATFGYPVGGVAVPVSKLGLVAQQTLDWAQDLPGWGGCRWSRPVALASLAALGAVLIRRRLG